MRMLLIRFSALLLLLAGSASRAAPVDFNKQIAPVLERKCVHCHNDRQMKGKLSLETVKSARRGGDSGPAIVPGKPATSVLIGMITGAKPEMPKNDIPLKKSEIQLIRKWIREGAKWPAARRLKSTFRPSGPWWSLQPVLRPAIPKLTAKTQPQALTPIDSFILAELQRRKMSMSPPARPRVLIRRLSFNLRGLPPTPAEVRQFLADESVTAYEKLVERFLASPQYGERWGRHWLDVVHYGDTHGYDKDKVRPFSYPYRDYVIRAFNADKPYGRFVTEQLAGDIQYPHSPDGIVATGFIAAGPWDFVGHVELRESLIDKQITRLLDRDDMVATTMNTFVSLTAQCARCHNHKFDPISQEDYYSLQAVFAGVERANRPYFADKNTTKRRNALNQQQAKLVTQQKFLRIRRHKLVTPAIRKLDQQIRAIQLRMSKNASLPVTKKTYTAGYHSQIVAKPNTTKWVQIDLGQEQPIEQVILVGSHIKYGGHPGPGFGFPARFRVDVASDAKFANKTRLVDNTKLDFPHPGDRPYIVNAPPNTKARFVRVTATKLWKRTNDFVFALSELLVFNKGKNLAQGARISALDSIEAKGGWGRNYLVDGVIGRTSWMDLANGKVKSHNNGYHSGILSTANHDKWVQVDLGKPTRLDRVRLLAARPTDFRDSPGFGFPVRFQVLASDDPKFRTSTVLFDKTRQDYPNPGAKPVTIELSAKKIVARYVRVLAKKLWKRTNDYTFALGELQIFSANRNVARGKWVNAFDTIEAGLWAKRFLVDGYDSRKLVESPYDLLLSFTGIAGHNRLPELVRQREKQYAAVADPKLENELKRKTQALAAIKAELSSLGKPRMVYAAASSFTRQGNFVPPPNGRPRPIHVLRRGDIKQPMKLVQPGTVSCFPNLPSRFGSSKSLDGPRRVALARWIVDSRNPLTWRSIVNRIWHYHFGRGLVDTPNDFGRMGNKPTHPQLLDWLAAEFRDGSQSLKQLHRLIVTSAVYRQSSRHNPAFAAQDNANRYYWRMNRRRLDAESIRDAVLLTANKLNYQMYGPGFRPFGFKDDHSPQYRYAEHDPNDTKTQRRSIYRFIVRSVPDPFMETLDCADPSLTVEKRNETITPIQALALLNNNFMVVMSKRFAESVAGKTDQPGEQISWAMNVAVGRSPKPKELQTLLKYRQEHGLANTCRLLLNLNEFVFVD